MKRRLIALALAVGFTMVAAAPNAANATTSPKVFGPVSPKCAELASTGLTSDVGYFVDDPSNPTLLFLNAEIVVNASTCRNVSYEVHGLAQDPVTLQYTVPVVKGTLRGDGQSNFVDIFDIANPYSANPATAQPLCFYVSTTSGAVQWDRGPQADNPGGSCIVIDPFSAPGGRPFY